MAEEQNSTVHAEEKTAKRIETDQSLAPTVVDDEIENVVLYGVSSNIGKRSSQQDIAITCQVVPKDARHPSRTYAILCDGMGGMEGGEKASQLCAHMIMDTIKDVEDENKYPDIIKNAIYQADDEVFSIQNEKGKRLNSGTTVCVVVVIDNRMYWASVGDSRIYLIRNGQCYPMTEDHNVMYRLREQIKTGKITIEEANAFKKKEALISYVGMGCVTLMDINTEPYVLKKNDYILLCSDGLYRSLTTDEIIYLLDQYPDDVITTAEILTSIAVGKGLKSQDNTTVALLKYT